ncbi:MAG TPA: nucleotidyltransferase family protein [Rhodanobacteraceae bacterium]|nr:nucleotidyltransferase family protein [Rhodanobacteraceae bacterium]
MIAHGVIVLAAGASRRLGQPKQLVEIDGEPLLKRVVNAALATAPRQCIVVLDESAPFDAVLGALDARIVRIADAATGMAASLRAGVAALDAGCEGALVVVTDQPGLHARHLQALCTAWRAAPAFAIASAYAGVIGVPALLPRSWFDAIAALSGDVGARDLLRSRPDVIAIAAPGLARDIDTPRDIETP